MSKPGPKPKLQDPEIRKRFCDAIRSGSTIELASKYAGVAERQYYEAMSRARAGDAQWAPLLSDVEAAEGAGAVQLLAVIRKSAMEGTWPAAAWILERRYPKMYGKHDSRFASEPVAAVEYVEPDDLVDSLLMRIKDTRRLRAAAELDGSHVAALTAMKLEADLAAQLSAELRMRADKAPPLSDADLVAQIAADVAALPPAVRARVQASTSGPSLRLVGSRKTTA